MFADIGAFVLNTGDPWYGGAAVGLYAGFSPLDLPAWRLSLVGGVAAGYFATSSGSGDSTSTTSTSGDGSSSSALRWETALDFGFLPKQWAHIQLGRYGLAGNSTNTMLGDKSESSLESSGWLLGALLEPCTMGKVRCTLAFQLGVQHLIPTAGAVTGPMDRLIAGFKALGKPCVWLRGYYIPAVSVDSTTAGSGASVMHVHSGHGFGFFGGFGFSADFGPHHNKKTASR